LLRVAYVERSVCRLESLQTGASRLQTGAFADRSVCREERLQIEAFADRSVCREERMRHAERSVCSIINRNIEQLLSGELVDRAFVDH
jgi:hypothetical protein